MYETTSVLQRQQQLWKVKPSSQPSAIEEVAAVKKKPHEWNRKREGKRSSTSFPIQTADWDQNRDYYSSLKEAKSAEKVKSYHMFFEVGIILR